MKRKNNLFCHITHKRIGTDHLKSYGGGELWLKLHEMFWLKFLMQNYFTERFRKRFFSHDVINISCTVSLHSTFYRID